MERKEIICISCPMGCHLEVLLQDRAVQTVRGNQCKRGVAYAQAECVHPTRMVTSTVVVQDGELPVVPVKTAMPIPKELIFPCMEALAKIAISAPIAVGDIVVDNVCGCGVDVVATRACNATGCANQRRT